MLKRSRNQSLFVMAFVLAFAGCATQHGSSPSATLSPAEYRQLYPRQALDNVKPEERQYTEQLLEQEYNHPEARSFWKPRP
jgi:hypothetical protein